MMAAAGCGKAGIGKHHAEIVIRDYGTIKVELDGDAAPISVQNFMDLAKDGFYDGLTFHRIIEGFMIQGGDPLGTGGGGSDETIKGEFSNNGVTNKLSHTRGAISMARSDPYDSASSQFFIVHQDATGLDGDYACFGYVTEGIEIVDQICADTPVIDDNGTVLKANQPVITTVTIID
jgi:peptidyl-prolyl cis-trans isomerase B (cyclophilin B)